MRELLRVPTSFPSGAELLETLRIEKKPLSVDEAERIVQRFSADAGPLEFLVLTRDEQYVGRGWRSDRLSFVWLFGVNAVAVYGDDGRERRLTLGDLPLDGLGLPAETEPPVRRAA